jgi:cyanophycinase-like exopeptidase
MKITTALNGALLCGAAVGTSAMGACLSAEAEANNAQNKANTGACSGAGIGGTIATSRDEDWFRLDVGAAGVIDISLAHDSGIDLEWYLYSGTGSTPVAFRSTMNNPETGSFNAPAAGTYYVRVKSQSGLGRYTLTATFPTTGGGGGGPVACTLPKKVDLGKTGNRTPVASVTSGGIVLMGGGLDVDAALQWMIGRAGGGDFVVLRSSGTNAYNDYIYAFGGINSVQTLLVTSTIQANDACVVQTIKNAGALFLAGGDQADYVNYFKGQGVGGAINYLINTKHAPVGGTSAGMAVQGQYYHPGGADNTTVLQNPTAVAIGNNFLAHGALTNLVTEPHFTERARQPRVTSFMASTLYNYGVTWPAMRAVAADERTAVAIDSAGIGKVFGSGSAHFAMPTGAPETLAPNTPLTWFVGNQAIRIFQVPGSATGANTFNLGTWSGTAGSTHYWRVTNGTLSID